MKQLGETSSFHWKKGCFSFFEMKKLYKKMATLIIPFLIKFHRNAIGTYQNVLKRWWVGSNQSRISCAFPTMAWNSWSGKVDGQIVGFFSFQIIWKKAYCIQYAISWLQISKNIFFIVSWFKLHCHLLDQTVFWQ